MSEIIPGWHGKDMLDRKQFAERERERKKARRGEERRSNACDTASLKPSP